MLLVDRVDPLIPVVSCYDEYVIGRALEHLPRQILCPLAIGNVLTHDQDDGTIPDEHGFGRLPAPEHRAVLAHVAQFPAHRPAKLLPADGDIPPDSLSIGFVKYRQYCSTDQFIDGVAELLRAKWVHGHDGTGRIHHEVHGRVVLEDRPPLFLALPQRLLGVFARGDVLTAPTNARLPASFAFKGCATTWR